MGTVGIAPITQFDTAEFKVRLAAEVKDFDPRSFMDAKSARRMERFAQFAVAASQQALSDSGLKLQEEDPYSVGCFISSGIGSLQAETRSG